MAVRTSRRTSMNAFRYFAFAGSAVVLLGAGPCGGDKITSPEATVASVQITATTTNPRAGETTILGATPVTAGGLAVPGVACTMVSASPAILLVSPDGGGWRGLGITAGTVVVTARCAAQVNVVTITVRPALVTLTVNKLGTGNGSVFINPSGGTYDMGTSVVVTATALSGSTFAGWGGVCPAGVNATCNLVLNSNQTATASFALGESFAGAPIANTVMGVATDLVGCTYTVSLSGTLTAQVTAAGGGAWSGTAAGPSTLSIVVTAAPNGVSCSGSSSPVNLTGPVSGPDANVSIIGNGANGSRTWSLTFTGARSGNTITGSLALKSSTTAVTTNGNTTFIFNKLISPYVMTKQ